MSQTVNGAGQVVANELSDEEKEKIYKEVQQLMESTRCIVQYELMLYIYNVIIKRLKSLGEYKDSLALVKEYSQKRRKLKKTGQEEIYQNMLKKKEAVSQAEDLQWVLKEADRIPDYKDTEEVRAWCEQEMERMDKQEQRRATIRLLIIVVVLVLVVIGAQTVFRMYK
ncbi:unknown [Clostridium sp. CAG:411]|jgi:uncharacterized membrane protein YheB (UPF0754 family)|nr:hypothetical protein [Lachnospiraceae bacterium]CDE47197.1 unknown [Clostridium sp. CAG:411]